MLYRASIADLKEGKLSRRYGYLVVVMQYYPRFVKKELIDEYLRNLAPDRELFTEFKQKDRELHDHDAAFNTVNYEGRFGLSPDGLAELERLSQMSVQRDVFLFCQCRAFERCHADLDLLVARHLYGAKIPYLRQSYPIFESRLDEFR